MQLTCNMYTVFVILGDMMKNMFSFKSFYQIHHKKKNNVEILALFSGFFSKTWMKIICLKSK